MTQGVLFEQIIRNIKPSYWEKNNARKYRDQVLEVLNDQNLGITGIVGNPVHEIEEGYLSSGDNKVTVLRAVLIPSVQIFP